MMRAKLLLGTSLALVTTLPALAQSADSAINLNLGSVVATGSAATASEADGQIIPLKAAYAVSAITKKVVCNASPAATAQSILTREPSIYANSTGPNGVQTNITFRAFNAGQFSETYDGVALNDLFNSGVTNQASNSNNVLLTTNDFDSVTLYRGINNPAVNSYNSLGGTIEYNPRKPTDNEWGEAGISYGSFNTFNWHVTLNTGSYYGVKQLFSFQRGTSAGWTQNSKDGNSNLYYALSAPFNDGLSEVYAYLVYNSNAGLVNQLTPVALIDQYGTRYQFPSSTYYNQDTDMNYLAVGGVKHQVLDNLQVDLKFFAGENDYVRTSFSNPNGAGIYSLNDAPATFAFWLFNPSYPSYEPVTGFSVNNNGAPFQYHYYGYYATAFGVQPSATWELPFNTIKFGGNLTFGHLHSREYWYGSTPVPTIPGYNNAWNEHDLRTLGSGWVQDEISLFSDRLKITPGLKYLWAETKDFDEVGYYYGIAGGVSNYTHYLSPTVNANLALLDNVDAYFAYGKNVKFPDISSYYSNIATSDASGNPIVEAVHTQPEFVNDYEMGLRLQEQSFTAAAGYYRENFTHTFITVTDPATGASTTTNGGASLYQGVELQLQNDFGSLFSPVVPGDVSGYLNYAYNSAYYLHSFKDAVAGTVNSHQALANVPNNLVSAGAAWDWQGWYAAVDTNFVGKTYINNAYTGTPSSAWNGGYFLTNLTLAKTLPVHLGPVNALRFALNIDNLFGVKYYDAQNSDINGGAYKEAIVGAPRGIYGSISAKF